MDMEVPPLVHVLDVNMAIYITHESQSLFHLTVFEWASWKAFLLPQIKKYVLLWITVILMIMAIVTNAEGMHQLFTVCSFVFAGLVKAKKYDWKDSNLALFGSDTEKQVKSKLVGFLHARQALSFEQV